MEHVDHLPEISLTKGPSKGTINAFILMKWTFYSELQIHVLKKGIDFPSVPLSSAR